MGTAREGQQQSGGMVEVPAPANGGRDQPGCPGGSSLWWGFPRRTAHHGSKEC